MVYRYTLLFFLALTVTGSRTAQCASVECKERSEQEKEIAKYEKAIATGGSYTELWKGARAVVRLADGPMAYAPESQRKKLFEKAIPWAEKAVDEYPAGAEGHFYLAVLLGLKAQAGGATASIFVARSIRKHAQRALELDPDVACAGPYRVLGRYYFKLPGLLGGDDELSKKLLAEGVRRCPADPMGRLFFAETLHELDQNKQAARQCRWILSHHPKSPTPKQKEARQGAEALLGKMGVTFEAPEPKKKSPQ